MLGNVIVIMYGGGFLALAAVIILLVMKWFRNEPMHLQQEKLQDAIGWKNAAQSMARDLKRAMAKNPEMTPVQITEFIEKWGPNSFDAPKLAITEQNPSIKKEGADAVKPVESVEPVE